MKVKQVVYIVLGFVLIVGIAYWMVNHLIPANQPEISVENHSVESPEYSNIHEKSQQDSGFPNMPGSPDGQTPSGRGFNDDGAGLTEGNDIPKGTQENGVGGPFVDLGVQSSSSEKDTKDALSPEEQKRLKLNVIRDELKKIALGDPQSVDFNKLDALLVELQEMGDENGVVGGVNIPQLRKIIAQSNKIIETSQNKGLLPGEDKNEKLKDEVKTLQDLQQGIIIKHE
ncbi:hypothetical protein THMIRHAM_20970 [Thiomicrorhabdus immobilis]|uniref:Uncharacterized protein n=1 Tax=Thiomicrorhabdus immobilis TaxID=2791037 RepID=A0ABM7MFP4_9GAMM|nr:hypothetical protein [Thiomicrorhabdus immobilis]BCN94312.1 hypothetical protein THMIRHAM_20970 [Thiomicrorhabdus immobilis]